MKKHEDDNKRKGHVSDLLDCNLLPGVLLKCKRGLVDLVEGRYKQCTKLKETKELSQEQK